MAGLGAPGSKGGKGSENPGNLKQQLLNGLMAFYRNNGTNHSPSGAAFNLAAVGAPTTTTGLNKAANAAMLLSGANRFESAVALPVVVPYTTSAWLSADWQTSLFGTALEWVSAAGTGSLAMGGFGAGEAALLSLSPGGPGGSSGSAYTLQPSNAWVHVVATYTDPRVQVWLNGAFVLASDDPSDGPSTITSAGLGDSGDGTHKAQFVGLWNRVLSAAEIAGLFGQFAGFDPTA